MECFTKIEQWPLRTPFVISGHRWTELALLRVVVRDGDHEGQGEGSPIFYRPGETASTLADRVQAICADGVPSRAALQRHDALDGAGNALDAALWDLEAKLTGLPVWSRLYDKPPNAKLTMCTISMATPEHMAAATANSAPNYPLLKLKLGADDDQDVERVEAVRDAAPSARIVIDANAGWTLTQLKRYATPLAALGVELIEQPLPPSQDDLLIDLKLPVPLCADESCQGLDALPPLKNAFQLVNIKLDKIGGLTRALEMLREAERLGLRAMVGNMLGTSLAMAPAFLLAQRCEYADLDGPILLQKDRDPATVYRQGSMQVPVAGSWGTI